MFVNISSKRNLGSKLIYLTESRISSANSRTFWFIRAITAKPMRRSPRCPKPALKTAAEYRRACFDELTKAEQKAAGLAQDVIKAEQRTKLQALTAPVDGVVQQLAVHTVGGVVTPAQALAVVVPLDSHLEIEAMVSNRDIGFVHAGQEAEIKIDTFSFTRYGFCTASAQRVAGRHRARQAAR